MNKGLKFKHLNVRKRWVRLLVLITILLINNSAYAQVNGLREIDFNSDWRFAFDSAGMHPNEPDYNHLHWRNLDLPHDWSIEDLPGPQSHEQVGPFSQKSVGGPNTGYTVGGTAWYRKYFTVEGFQADKLFTVYFDGVYMESDVWVNGHHVGYHPNGYMSFFYNITPYLNPVGKSNCIAVKVKNIGNNSRWYSGSGIYRNVSLIVTNKIRIPVWGTFITTPNVSKAKATVNFSVNIENTTPSPANVKLRFQLLSKDGKKHEAQSLVKTVNANGIVEYNQSMEITAPQLWSPNTPNLYKAVIKALVNDEVVDEYVVNIGIRSLSFSAEKGFLLNGETTLLKGANIHHDNGILGAAAFNRAEERKIELLKSHGFNAVRCVPPLSSQLLDACDRLGLMVIQDAFDMWERAKTPQDYHLFFKEWWKRDLSAMVLRDRNHPAEIMWSIGNEIKEMGDSSGYALARQMAALVKSIDPSRPVTMAAHSFIADKYNQWKATLQAFAPLDVTAYNYQWWTYEEDHQRSPGRVMFGTESFPVEAYENTQIALQKPYVLGDFVWSAIDYLGENGCGHAIYLNPGEKDSLYLLPWPYTNAWCGDIDLIGNKKPQSFYRDVVWGISKLEMAVHEPIPAGKMEAISGWGWPNECQSWNWPGHEGEKLEVTVYSTHQAVRIELNGNVIGEKMVPKGTRPIVKFEVPYQVGQIKAIGLENGKEVGVRIISTTGPAKSICLTPDRKTIRTNRNDLAFFKIEVIDEQGNIIPNANIPVEFEVLGNGELQAVGNSKPNEPASFKQPRCKTFRGRALLVIRPTGLPGEIIITAKSELGVTKAAVQAK